VIQTLLMMILLSISIFAGNLKLAYSYGIHDFVITSDSSHTIGVNSGIYLEYIHDGGMSQTADFEASAEYDRVEHDSDHIPVLFRGTYRVQKAFVTLTRSLSLKGMIDLDWKMNTVSGIEQSLKTALGGGIGYQGETLSFELDTFLGSYYLEIDDDTPRVYGYSRDELSRGFIPTYGYMTALSYRMRDDLWLSSSYREWREGSAWREKSLKLEINLKQSSNSVIGCRIEKSLYDLTPLNVHSDPILPWDRDILFHIFIKQQF